MKSEKGITLISLIVYVIAMVITVTIVTVITAYFYKNVDVTGENYTYSAEFTSFQNYFVEEANLEKNSVLEISENQSTAGQNYIILESGNQYTYVKANKSIYQNNVKIAKNVEACTFSKVIKNGKEIITVIM